MRKIPSSLCIRCKGFKNLCGLGECPILKIYRSRFQTYSKLSSKYVDGSTPPSLLVGEYGYPKVRVMLNLPPGVYSWNAEIYDSPLRWWGKYNLEDIIKLRSSLLSNVIKVDIKDVWRLYEKEISISSVSFNPVDVESRLSKTPQPSLRFDDIIKPIGLTAYVEDIKITSSPRIGRVLEKRIFDDVKASDTVIELYKSGYDIYRIINALSSGLLGRLRDRKIVPTRWAITAVDSILGDYFRKRLTDKPYIDNIRVFTGRYLSNRFIVILYPGPLQIEWIEAWHPRSIWNISSSEIAMYRLNEDYRGNYSDMDGGYMAARLPVLEYLYKIGRQATVFIYREISPDYYAPVGNWHIRETVKNMLSGGYRVYDDLFDAIYKELKYFRIPVDTWIERSKLIKDIFGIRRLTEFI